MALGTLVTMVLRNGWLAVHGAHVVGARVAPYATRIYMPAGAVLAVTVLLLRAPVALGWIRGWAALLAAATAGCLVFGLLASVFVLDADDRRLLKSLGRGRPTRLVSTSS